MPIINPCFIVIKSYKTTVTNFRLTNFRHFLIARDSPGIALNVPRPGQTQSGTMKRPGLQLCYIDIYLTRLQHGRSQKIFQEGAKVAKKSVGPFYAQPLGKYV